MNLKKANPLRVLLIGRSEWLMWSLPSLLSKVGCVVDVLTSSKLMKSCLCIEDCDIIPENACIMTAAVQKCQKHYDWIIITEDLIQAEIAHSNLPIETKLKLLPVLKEENFSHIHSKIGLSKALSNQGIQTPPFYEVVNIDQALEAAEQMGYPVLLKIDASGGGFGVYECLAPSDFNDIDENVWLKPVLLQKKIEGLTLDLSALYLKGELIHFSYSKSDKVVFNKFGPSSLRTYTPLSSVDKKVFDELREIGKALGVHCFTNITCIEAYDGSGRFYIEVDTRPNVWVNAPLFFGEDVAERISRWFSNGEKLHHPVPISEGYPEKIIIPFFLRLTFFELLTNRYDVWKFIQKNNGLLISKLLLKKTREFLSKFALKNIVKRFTPKKYHKTLKQIYRAIFAN